MERLATGWARPLRARYARNLTVSFDICPLLVRSAGVKTYLYHWIRAIRSTGRLQIRTYPLALGDQPLDHERSLFPAPATLWALFRVGRPGVLTARLFGPPRPRADVFHASVLTYVAPRRTLLTSTIYDLTHLLNPELHRAGTLTAQRHFEDYLLPRCRALVCISESTRRDAERFLRFPAKNLHVIYPGIDPRFFDARPWFAESSRKPAWAAKLPASYVLFLSTIEPRKNLDRLLDAWLKLPRDLRLEHPLVVAGPEGWHAAATMERLRYHAPEVIYLGYVPEGEILGLVAGATVFACPSLYEGFGFPLAQAMAAGVPCLTSANSSLQEIAGDAALLVDPLSVSGIRHGLQRLLEHPELRQRYSAWGRQRARQFTWERSAQQAADFFESL